MSAYKWEKRRKKDTKRINDVRNEWERDHARLIHSAAFRRLQSKTQVLGLGESDFYRTRLTHSMEVAQIGSGILRCLKHKYEHQNSEIYQALPDVALMSAICLAHDIGHPPFGHGGEVALNICMREHGGFEGNGQTLRILSCLDKYTDGYGMNPTRRLLLGVLKYPASYTTTVQDKAYGEIKAPRWLSEAEKQKPPKCYLSSENDVVNWILKPLNTDEKAEFVKLKMHKSGHLKPMYKALDTSIMELADDISYSLHDLEDAISLGMITRSDWENHNQANEEGSADSKENRFKACGLDSNKIAEKLFSNESYQRKNQIGDLVNQFITNAEVKPTGILSASCDLIKWNAVLDKQHEQLLEHIFDLVKDKVIKSTNVQQLEFKGQKLVIELFEALASDPTRLLPTTTIVKYQKAETEIHKQRVICDYISGMTDEYATRLYEKIYYPHRGSIFDRL
ncbi:anti-phage deoxyguanosine triphosphatase [Acinetobacter gandensis]|uniref:anti-phage deoxyguanosine triphosphatase n=1 Tax=Acinetobacter gandensis TaxID=1443941 RepID=UPI003989A086